MEQLSVTSGSPYGNDSTSEGLRVCVCHLYIAHLRHALQLGTVFPFQNRIGIAQYSQSCHMIELKAATSQQALKDVIRVAYGATVLNQSVLSEGSARKNLPYEETNQSPRRRGTSI